MYYALLVLGLILWSAAHLFKRAMPDARARMGDAGRGVVAVLLVVALVLMIIGYRGAPFDPVYYPAPWLTHVNNLLMIVAVFLFGMSATTGRLRGRLRHPMLGSVKVWALAHLLVNGDVASIILFGGMLAWAVSEVIVINKSEAWARPAPGPAKKDIILVVTTVVAYAVMTGVHIWLGVWPFG